MGLRFLLAGLSFDAAVVLLTLGIALVCYELNRPGSIVPGAVGLLTVLLSCSVLGRRGLNPLGVVLILSAVALLTVNLLRPTPMLLSLAATVVLVAGLRWLAADTCCAEVHTPVAVCCGAALGGSTSVLSRIAQRARSNKAINHKRRNKGLDY